jgi:hypothetical protein
MRSDQIQNTLLTLRKGDVLQLKVGLHPKTGKPAFIPEFENGDIMAGDEDTVRFFNPVNEVELNRGEVWEVEIQNIYVSGKRSRDERLLVFVSVNIINRVETIRESIERGELTGDIHVIVKMSGTRLLSHKAYPLTCEARWCQERNMAIRAILCYSQGNLVHVDDRNVLSQDTYVRQLVKNGMGKISPASAVKAFEKLPSLPTPEKIIY